MTTAERFHRRATPHHPIIAFLGPSMPLDDARARFPDVHFMPPVCQGDLLSAWDLHRPDVIVVLDGEFGQSLSVWHKEILFVIDKGVHVVGASSMGALRAAELERFGMIGVGEVFRHYSGAFLTADEDVALLHGDADWGWKPFTWPMVNCRATATALAANGTITTTEQQAVLDALASLHFSRRIEPALAAALADAGHANATDLASRFARGYIDQKQLDAIAGIEHGLSLIGTPPAPHEAPLHLFGRVGESMWEADTLVPSSPTPLRKYQLANDAALHEPDFESLSQRALDRLLALEYAFENGIVATDEEAATERARFMSNRQLDDGGLNNWMRVNDIDDDEFDRLMREEAVRRRMQRWGLDTKLYGRNRQALLDQMRLEGRYPGAVQQAARRRALADARPPLGWPRTEQEVVDLILRHHIASGWRAQLSLEFTQEDHGFESVSGFIVALLDATAARQEASERRERLARAFGIDTSAVASKPKAPAAAPAPQPTLAPTASGSATTDERTVARDLHRTLELHQFGAIIAAAVELQLFDHLADAPSTEQLAARTATQPHLLERLCYGLCGIQVLRGDSSGWSITAAGELLSTTHRASLAPYARDMRAVSVPAWSNLAAIVRGEGVAAAALDDEQALDADLGFSSATFSLAMDTTVSALIDPTFAGHVADVGGGLGRLAMAISDRAPDATVTVIERAEVVERSRAATAHSRVRVAVLDEVLLPINRAVLQRVLCTLPDSEAEQLLTSLRARLAPDASVYVVDTVHDGSLPAASVDLFNLVRTGGIARTDAQWQALAARCGFTIAEMSLLAAPFSTITLHPSIDQQGAPHK